VINASSAGDNPRLMFPYMKNPLLAGAAGAAVIMLLVWGYLWLSFEPQISKITGMINGRFWVCLEM
jgi:hypothetical protein